MVTDDTFNLDDVSEAILEYLAGMEIENVDAVVPLAVDFAIRYVVEWLASTGYAAKGEILESLCNF